MNSFCKLLLLGASVTVLAQDSVPTAVRDSKVMLAAVSRNDSVLTGGIGTGRQTKQGKVYVEPMVLLTESGEWKSIPCNDPRSCLKFEREYLRVPHSYTVVSADGRGATIRAAPTTLSECFDYTGKGTYEGAVIGGNAIAADSAEMFSTGTSASRLTGQEAEPIRKAVAALIPAKLDSMKELRIYSLRLEGQDLFVVQRAFQDYASKPGYDPQEDHLKLIFAIGTMKQGRFLLLHWKRNIEYENELVMGTIHLKSGKDFLVTSVSDPESQLFRIYGIKDGRLSLVYSGGGSSC